LYKGRVFDPPATSSCRSLNTPSDEPMVQCETLSGTRTKEFFERCRDASQLDETSPITDATLQLEFSSSHAREQF
jgi:hypothetical protein